MADISVNEYVRTKQGYIAKVEYADEYCVMCESEILKEYGTEYHSLFGYNLEQITKHSFNLTDLIEVGDYVNGYLIMEDEGKLKRGNAYVVFKRNEHSYMEIWAEKDIKTIVTKEQFKAMEYKVGEEKDG